MYTKKGGHRFPQENDLRKKWIQAVKRGEQKWQPSKYTLVCTSHFDGDHYNKKNYNKR